MLDVGRGLDETSFEVTASFDVAGMAAGQNLAPRVVDRRDGTRWLSLPVEFAWPPSGNIAVSVRDRSGNRTQIVRSFDLRTLSRPAPAAATSSQK
jgi:hypothetical protein